MLVAAPAARVIQSLPSQRVTGCNPRPSTHTRAARCTLWPWHPCSPSSAAIPCPYSVATASCTCNTTYCSFWPLRRFLVLGSGVTPDNDPRTCHAQVFGTIPMCRSNSALLVFAPPSYGVIWRPAIHTARHSRTPPSTGEHRLASPTFFLSLFLNSFLHICSSPPF